MRTLLAPLLGLLLVATPAAAAPWRPPVPGGVVRTFELTPGAPFAAGQHRTLTFAGRPGAPVRAVCAGRVTFAGRLPRGAGVTVACARSGLRAGHTGLGSVAVGRGATVARGALLGTAAGPRVALSARRGGRYVDPAAFLEDPPPVAPRPRGPAPPPAPPLPARGPLPPAPAPVRVLVRPLLTADPAVPPVAWTGLAALATGVGTGGLWRRRRRARRAAGARARAPAGS